MILSDRIELARNRLFISSGHFLAWLLLWTADAMSFTGARFRCALFGHLLSNSTECECGAPILRTDGIETRIRHVVHCFLSGHQYVYCTTRNEHDEYACTKCGHPLLFRIDMNPYHNVLSFRKKVRYLCGLLGHSVHTVGFRNDFVEYACNCGHTFLKKDAGRAKIKHPPLCLFAGHFVRPTRQDGRFSEFACSNCRHTFLLSL